MRSVWSLTLLGLEARSWLTMCAAFGEWWENEMCMFPLITTQIEVCLLCSKTLFIKLLFYVSFLNKYFCYHLGVFEFISMDK